MFQSGFTPCNQTFLGDTRANIVTNLISLLVANGWTVITTTSATDKVLESGLTPTGQKVRVHIKDPGSGNCAQILPQRASVGTDITAMWLVPGASSTYRVIANPYQFFIFRDGVLPNAREFACVIVPCCPPGVAALSGDIFFAYCNGTSDSDTTVNPNPSPVTGPYYWYAGVQIFCIGSNVWSLNNAWSTAGMQIGQMYNTQQGSYAPWGAMHGMDGSWLTSDFLIGWGLNSGANAQAVGWIWDAVLIYENPGPLLGSIRSLPITANGSGHNFFVLGNNLLPALALQVN